MNNTLAKQAGKLVPIAVTAAGGSVKSVPMIIAALPLGSKALMAVPGMDAKIAAAAGGAYQQAWIVALR